MKKVIELLMCLKIPLPLDMLNQIKNDDFFYDVSNSFDKSGIGYQMVVNPFNNIHQIWKVDSSSTHGFLILPPHEKPNVELIIGYNDYQIILGIKRYKYGKHCLNLGIEATVFRGAKEPPKMEPKPNLDKFFSKDDKNLKNVFHICIFLFLKLFGNRYLL